MSYYIHKINNKAVLGGITIMAKIVQTAGRIITACRAGKFEFLFQLIQSFRLDYIKQR